MTKRIEVGLHGATGAVGRCLVDLLAEHPWFRLSEVGGSPESAGRSLADAMAAAESAPPLSLADEVGGLVLKRGDEDWGSPLILSAVPGALAGPLEADFARRGHLVVSNASAHRMDPQVPLIIPEINPDHLGLVEAQSDRWPGAVVTNPNCSVVGLALALAPLQAVFGIESVMVTTFQSTSGAGRVGPDAAEFTDNVVPYIAGEEEKIAREPQKILGELVDGKVEPADFRVSAQAHRVPVAHGHLLAVSAKLRRAASPEDVAGSLASFESAESERLHSAPPRPIQVMEDESRPQPKLDRDREGGMIVSVGRVRSCEVLDVKFSVLVHNLVRGAAGAALLNAELCHAAGLTARSPVA